MQSSLHKKRSTANPLARVAMEAMVGVVAVQSGLLNFKFQMSSRGRQIGKVLPTNAKPCPHKSDFRILVERTFITALVRVGQLRWRGGGGTPNHS
jgi:hypothetical protein